MPALHWPWDAAFLALASSAALFWIGRKWHRREAFAIDTLRDQTGLAVLVIAGMLIASRLGPFALETTAKMLSR